MRGLVPTKIPKSMLRTALLMRVSQNRRQLRNMAPFKNVLPIAESSKTSSSLAKN